MSEMDCASGFCVDGVCCDLPCSSTCYACSAAKKGSGPNGTCGPIAAETDPDNECNGGRCNAYGACQLYNGPTCTSNAQCFSKYCVDGICCEESCSGTCQACSAAKKGGGNDGSCGPIAANTDPDNECEFMCDGNGACTGAANGVTCISAMDCASGHCVDGVCCNKSCLGSCLSCNIPTAIGTCTAQCPGTCAGTLGFPAAPLSPLPDVGYSFIAAASSDFNGDGKPDFAALDSWAKVVSVFINLGGGVFATNIDYPAGPSPKILAAKDLNGDGKPDLVTLDTSLFTAAVHLNQGNGTFAPRVDYPTGTSTGSLSIADLNADTWPDFVIEGNVVLMNQGNGTFVPYSGHGLTKSGWVTTGDLNGDGSPDIVTVDAAPSYISYNQGNATFAAPKMHWLNSLGAQGALSDVNGDGKLDLVVLNEDSVSYTVALNDGNGGLLPSFVNRTNFPYQYFQSQWFELADFNGDGRTDLMITEEEEKAVNVAFGNGNGKFGTMTPYPTRGSVRATAIADFTGDGNVDIVAVNSRSTNLFSNQGNGVFEPPGQSYPVAASPVQAEMADFNGDGQLDIVIVAAMVPGPAISVLFNLGNGSFGGRTDYALAAAGNAIIAADLTGDGNDEIIVGGLNTMSVFRNQGDGTFAARVDYNMPPGPYALVAADFTGDGRNDVALASYTWSQDFSGGQYEASPSFNMLSVYVNLGNGNLGSPKDKGFGGMFNSPGHSGPNGLAAADITGDGNMDLIWSHVDKGVIRILPGQGNGTFTDGPTYSAPGTSTVALVDMNGDGLSDLVAASSIGVSVFLNQGSGNFGARMDHPIRGTTLAIADLNGDGEYDFARTNPSNHTIDVALNQGSTFGPSLQYASGGVKPNDVVAYDMNTDGQLDLLVVNKQNNQLSVLLNACLP